MISRFTMIWILLAVLAGGALFVIKHEVQEAESDLIALQRQIDAERETIHVLEAEWSYLTRPSRLERLSDRYLDLQPANGAQILPAIDLSALPLRREELEIAAAPAGNAPSTAGQTAAPATSPAETQVPQTSEQRALASRLPPVPKAKPTPPRRAAPPGRIVRATRNGPPPPPPAPPIPTAGDEWLKPILAGLGRAR